MGSMQLQASKTSCFIAPCRIGNSSDYVAVLVALIDAVEDGIWAVASNRLTEFNRQLAWQEELCARLQDGLQRRAAVGADGRRPPMTWDPTLEERIRTEHNRLTDLSRRYAAFLRHCSRTVRLLAAHCQSCSDELGATGGREPGAHTWLARY